MAMPAAAEIEANLHMNFRNQRARRVVNVHAALLGLRTNSPGNSVRTEYDNRIVGHLNQFINKHRALGGEPIDDEFVVHDFMTNVDRRPMDL